MSTQKNQSVKPTTTTQPDQTGKDKIAQPNPKSADDQDYIKENAKKGASIIDPLAAKTMGEGHHTQSNKPKDVSEK